MSEGNSTKQQAEMQIQLYKAYLDDLGRIGGRHENSRKFYMSIMSALFVFLSMAGKDGVFDNVQGDVLVIVGVVGILMCFAWFEHMRSFGALFLAKLSTLRSLEKNLPLKPFTVEWKALPRKVKRDKEDSPTKLGYSPLTVVDRIAPVACGLLFVGLLLFKILENRMSTSVL